MDGGEHADFLSRENYQNHYYHPFAQSQQSGAQQSQQGAAQSRAGAGATRAAGGSAVQRMEQDTWGFHHHSADAGGSAVGLSHSRVSDGYIGLY